MTPEESKMKEVAKEVFLECFQGFSDKLTEQGEDVKEIKAYIVGDEYHPHGVIKRLEKLEEYVETNKSVKLAKRGLKVIEWWEGLNAKKGSDGKSELQMLQDGISGIQSIQNLKNWAKFLGFTNIGTLAALVVEFFLKR